ncbi:hypothetical protein [Campylobacter gastrosuis]|uniref:Uncharacterized protein n=1 Tax=Campylobacter gastrosuis TaxID=2974576 RepID=A0ABT7HRR6_9BACT|nr:hypothetical protein [Campylobacter gastrosuis]MDL0089594.1 hypothetical protein [Campylobacter gastrosuis]
MLFLEATSLNDYVLGFEILGQILNKKDRADTLIAYAKESLKMANELNSYIKQNNLKKPKFTTHRARTGF